MKTLRNFLLLVALFLVPVILFAQTNIVYSSNLAENIVLTNGDINSDYTVLGGDYNDAQENITIVNGVVHENLLLSSIAGSVSVVDLVKVFDNTLIVAGRPNIIGSGDDQIIITVYSLPNVELQGFVKFRYLALGSRIMNVIMDGNNLYFSINGLDTASYWESSFGNYPPSMPGDTGSLLNTTSEGIFKFDMSSSILSKQLYRPSDQLFVYESLVKSGNYLYQLVKHINNIWHVEKYDSNLNLISSSPQVYGENISSKASKMMVDNENGVDYLYLYMKDVTDSSNRKGLRKINTNTMLEVASFKEGTGASTLSGTYATEICAINGNRITVLSREDAHQSIMVYDKTSGNILSYKKMELNNSLNNVVSGISFSAMYYESTSNILHVAGITGADSTETDYSFYGASTPTGAHIIEFDYIPEIHPDSDMTMTIVEYPGATITRGGNTFTVTGIPESAWSSLTINASLVNPNPSFTVYPGNGTSWLKNFTDTKTDYFHCARSIGTTGSNKIWDVSIFIVIMSDGLGTDDEFVLEKKLYPNPTNDLVYLPEIYQDYSVEVYDLLGQKLFAGDDDVISLNSYPSGIYLIKITDPETQKFGIQKVIKK